MSLKQVEELIDLMHKKKVIKFKNEDLEIEIGQFISDQIPEKKEDPISEAVKELQKNEDDFMNEFAEIKQKLGE
jgi:NAD(P)H-flavin reductase